MEPGSAAEWLGGASTLAAFLGAAWAARYARKAAEYAKEVVEIERARDDLRDQEKRQGQATLVAAWLPSRVEMIGGLVTVSFGPGSATAETREDVAIVPERLPVTLRNASVLPVSRLTIDLYVKAQDSTEWLYAGSRMHGLMAPDTTETVEVMSPNMSAWMREVLDGAPSTRDTPPHVAVGWTFVDNAGLTWRRNADSALAQVDRRDGLRLASDDTIRARG